MIRYDEHAEFQIGRRSIEKSWMLRVLTPLNDPEYVISAYFDRTKPCA
jgi:hypothetical protein